jgi:Bacterial DNA polymerase III alpha NTPase domain
MKYDKFGQAYTTTEELCELLYRDPAVDLSRFLVEDWDRYNTSVKRTYSDLLPVQEYHPLPPDYDIDVFHRTQQESWHMPAEYRQLDIAQHVLDLCTADAELQRVGEELLLYQERDLFDLLRYLKYFVDTMRANSVVWGLGRGSSVSSYVLYLLGVHKIDSLYYDLPIEEFLK